MVSTRGGARTSGPDDSKQATIRKKPVRKATTKPTPAASKAKTTRSKKAEPEPEPEPVDDDGEDEIQAAVPQLKARRQAPAAKPEPTKRAATTRVKKDEEPVKAAASKPPPKTTKSATSARATKSNNVKEDKPDLPPPTQAKATRATRTTRAAAAKARPPPLSPKKITQVSKAPPKNTRTASQAKAPTTQAKSTTRRRKNVSDENADAAASRNPDMESEDEISVQTGKKTKVAKAEPKSTLAPEPSVLEHETPASSRPTTPSDGFAQSFNGTEDETLETNEQEASDSREDEDPSNNSQDELCGPKTPMKRSSPRFGTQKNNRTADLGIPSNTPVRRFAVLGTQQGTPQTTKPYRKPSVPASAIRPTTVSRARDRAMVFPRLQPLDTEADESGCDQSGSIEEQSTPVPVQEEFLNGDWDLNMEDNAFDQHPPPEPQAIEEPHASVNQSSHAEHPAVLEHNATVDPMSDIQSLTEQLDMEESIILQDVEPESGPISPIEASFVSDESVIVTRPAAHEGEPGLDEEMQLGEMPTETPKPETLVWDNIRQDVTIPFNFDVDMTSSRSLPQVQHNDRLSIMNDFTTSLQSQPEVFVGAQEDQDVSMDDDVHQVPTLLAETPEQKVGHSRKSLDATVNLSDFLDVKSLSESRRQSKIVDVSADDEVRDVSEVQRQTPTPAAVNPAHDESEFESALDDSPNDTQLATEGPATFCPARSTPARGLSELDVALNDLQQLPAPDTPRYAQPTISSRRKSLPAKLHPGTLFAGARPNTSEGVSLPSIATPSRASIRMRVPVVSRPTTSHGINSAAKPKNQTWTPRTARTPRAKTPETSVPLDWQTATKKRASLAKTPIARQLFAGTPGTSVPETIKHATQERFPGLPSRNAYELEHAIATPSANVTVKHALFEERFPALPACHNYDSNPETPSANTPLSNVATAVKSAPQERFPGLPSKDTCEELNRTPTEEEADEPTTPQTAEPDRYPGLPCRRTYEEHAKTSMPTSRFRTPKESPAKRPATVQKQASLRKVALKASTPMRTPLKAPAFTPGQVPMTPHPAAPLRHVVALVEVYTSDGDCATPAFVALLQRLGAKTTKTFSERVTHVVYKEGSPNTLQRLRIHNKQVAESGTGKEIHCVNSRWVTDCDTQGTRMPETDEAYAVEVDDAPRTAKRRRKSMEPMSLRNVSGSVFRDRKSSLGKSSLGRAPMKMDSPSEDNNKIMATPEDKENSGDDGSPTTPAYLAAPSSLVQQTAPLNKVRKLDFKAQEAAKNRRLTFWKGGA